MIEEEDKMNKQVRLSNHKAKVQLWELKTQLMELKNMIEEEEEENKKLVEEYEYANRYREGEVDEGEEGEEEGDGN